MFPCFRLAKRYLRARQERLTIVAPTEQKGRGAELFSESLERRDLLTLPPGFSIEPFVAGLIEPIGFDYAPDGRVFVAEKAGRVQIVDNGNIVGTFIDLRDEVNSQKGRGLIGLALDPQFAANQRVYLNFTAELQPTNPDSTAAAGGSLIRVAASTANPNVADLSTRVTLLEGHDNPATTHSVGDIDFDANGNVVVSWGDGGLTLAYRLAAQNPDSVQGKIFRISPEDGAGIPGNPYYDPLDPWSTRSRVLAVGVRNAWRMSRDTVSGNIYFGDVTDNGPEEVNVIQPSDIGSALNFGWPYYEGQNRTAYGVLPNNFVSTAPWISYPHIGDFDAITSGIVFRGSNYPSAYDGKFYFANYGQDVVYTATETGTFTEFGRDEWSFPVDIRLAPSGRIQMASIAQGILYELVHNSSPTGRPSAIAAVTNISGLTASFNSAASSDPDNDVLKFHWDFDQDGHVDSTLANPTFTFFVPGVYQVLLTAVDTSGQSSPATIEVQIEAENMAVGKPASQSSTPSGEDASIAVDGSVTTGHSSTGVDPQAWWQVDLLANEPIGEITIFHNENFSPGVIRKYYVLVADTPFTGGSLTDALINADWTYYCDDVLTPARVFTVGQLGRYVRIQLAGTKSLSLREVQVYRSSWTPNMAPLVGAWSDTRFATTPYAFKFNSIGTSDPDGNPLTYSWDFGDGQKSSLPHPANTYVNPGTYTVRLTVQDSLGAVANKAITIHVLPRLPEVNLAFGKASVQSSTAYGGLASRAVDGKEFGDHVRKKSVSHTARQRQPFWQVDLGQVYKLDLVMLFNRSDVGPNKLKDAWILVSETPFGSDDLETVRSAAGTWSTFVPGLVGRQRSVDLGVQGRYLRVQLAGNNSALALAEVIVRGTDLTTFTFNGHQYRLTSSAVDWLTARSQAQALEGTLVAIDDATENEWLKQTFGPGLYHTDLTDRFSEESYGWESQQTLSYSYWAAGNPNAAIPDGDFGQFDGLDGQWRQGTSTDLRFGIIEIGPPLVNQFFHYNGKLYGLTQTETTFFDARIEAASKNGNLVKVEDAAENSWLSATFGPRHYFIGLSDQLIEGQFRWHDGTNSVFTNFETGEPNDLDGLQDGVIFSGATGRWYDWSAAFLAYAIIEYALPQ